MTLVEDAATADAIVGALGAELSVVTVIVLSGELEYITCPSFTLPYIVCVAVSVQKLCAVNVQLLSAEPAPDEHKLVVLNVAG